MMDHLANQNAGKAGCVDVVPCTNQTLNSTAVATAGGINANTLCAPYPCKDQSKQQKRDSDTCLHSKDNRKHGLLKKLLRRAANNPESEQKDAAASSRPNKPEMGNIHQGVPAHVDTLSNDLVNGQKSSELLVHMQRQNERLKQVIRARDRRIQELERELDKLQSVLDQQLASTWVEPHQSQLDESTGTDNVLTCNEGVETTNASPTEPEPNASIGENHNTNGDVCPPAAALLLRKRLGVSGEPVQLAQELHYYEKDTASRQQIREAFRSNDLLVNLDAVQLQEIVSCMYERSFPAGSFIIREGDDGDNLYVGAAGEYEVSKGGKQICVLRAGSCFGEVALLYNCKRTASVKALVDSRVWVLERSSFQVIMCKTGMERIEERKAFLRSVPVLKKLSAHRILRIADALEAQYHAAGDCIIRQGELADSFFLIQSGKVKVTLSSDPAKELTVRELSKGEYFGEKALLGEGRRTANVYAMGPNGVDVLCLYRKDFLELIGGIEELKDQPYYKEHLGSGSRSSASFVAASPAHTAEPAPAGTLPKDATKGQHTTWSKFVVPGLHKPAGLQLNSTIRFEDLEHICVLGVGGFGRVDLVTLAHDRTQSFALKRMQKQHIVQTRQQEHVHLEKLILSMVNSPFICKFYGTHRDNKYVYLLLEACLGGELWTILRDCRHMDDRMAKFSLSCCIEALGYLHRHGILYRDLKPENMLVTSAGYIKLCDFGFAKYIGSGQKTWTFCGTPEYVAPEVILNKGHDFAADYWSLGILTFELLTGTPPFQAPEPIKIYMKTLRGIDALGLAQNKFISLKALHFIRRLCRSNPSERLGVGKHGIQEIRSHKYFQGFDWGAVAKQTMPSPFKVKVMGPLDCSNFDRFSMDEQEAPDELSGWDADF